VENPVEMFGPVKNKPRKIKAYSKLHRFRTPAPLLKSPPEKAEKGPIFCRILNAAQIRTNIHGRFLIGVRDNARMARIWLGTSGFSYKEWRPMFYPEGLPDKQFLPYYSSKLNSVEIDYTFYRMPSAKTIEAWKNATPEHFNFTLKASQQITHRQRLKVPSEALDYFVGVVPGLESRLGMVLFQLPPFFKCDAQKLEMFLSVLPRGVPSAFEFRHESWFNAEVYRLLRQHNIALCIHDADDHTTPMELTAAFTYIRLRRSQYDDNQRREWQDRFRRWTAEGVDVFAYIKHEDNPEAPLIALEFARGL
jgi:uncharacterized protein YecE (DUF72 family)